MEKKKIYFLSDVHLGATYHKNEVELERKLCRWLAMAQQDAQAIYLLGDIFDYWFEYRYVVPRGFTRVLGKLAEITDLGTEVHFFIGNHDLWLSDYIEKECGLIIHREAYVTELSGKKFFLHHGDGLGDDSLSFRFLRKIFHSKILRIPFAALHPRWTVGLALAWSRHNRLSGFTPDFLGEENEHVIKFAKEELKRTPDIDYFIFGHRHIFLDFELPQQTHLIILGDWIKYFSYAVFDGEKTSLLVFNDD